MMIEDHTVKVNKYSEREYWDDRFADEFSFEWLTDFSAFEHLLLPELTHDQM